MLKAKKWKTGFKLAILIKRIVKELFPDRQSTDQK